MITLRLEDMDGELIAFFEIDEEAPEVILWNRRFFTKNRVRPMTWREKKAIELVKEDYITPA